MTDTTMPPPLAAFAGAPPPAPQWFRDAIAQAPERTFHEVDGVRIEALSWGEAGKPGLLLLHGGAAHADWWSFLAPFFAGDYRVTALSWSGMGRSGWRPAYSIDGYVTEMLAIAERTGLFAGPLKPVVLAHSFGGLPTIRAAARHGDRLGGAILLDAPIQTPAQRARRDARKSAPAPRETRIYASQAEALLRFRFQPAQKCENPFIADFIARGSLREVEQSHGGKGWTWCFDPFMWSKLARSDTEADLQTAACPLAILWGQQSRLFPPDVIAYVRAIAPAGTQFVEIPAAEHHVMVDQPLAIVTAVRALLAGWQSRRR